MSVLCCASSRDLGLAQSPLPFFPGTSPRRMWCPGTRSSTWRSSPTSSTPGTAWRVVAPSLASSPRSAPSKPPLLTLTLTQLSLLIFLPPSSQALEKEEAPPAALEALQALEEELNETDSREERVFRYWINSLGVDSACESLFDDVGEDGFLLLSILEKLQGEVEWRRVAKPPVKLPFKKVENLNYALDVARQPPIKAVLVGIQGKDVFDGNKKLTLALIWQLMRYDFMRTVRGISTTKGGGPPSDSEVMKWANATVQAQGTQGRTAGGFRDPSLADGIFLLDLLAAVDKNAVNWDLAKRGNDQARLRFQTVGVCLRRFAVFGSVFLASLPLPLG